MELTGFSLACQLCIEAGGLQLGGGQPITRRFVIQILAHQLTKERLGQQRWGEAIDDLAGRGRRWMGTASANPAAAPGPAATTGQSAKRLRRSTGALAAAGLDR